MRGRGTGHALAAGIGAGALWGLFDWLAAGPFTTPWAFLVGNVAAGVLLGLAAAAAAVFSTAPRSAGAWVLALVFLAQGSALVSKEFSAGRGIAVGFVLLGSLALRLGLGRAHGSALALALAAMPLSAVAWWWTGSTPAGFYALNAVLVLGLLGWQAWRRMRGARAFLLLAVACLAGARPLLDPARSRAPLPREGAASADAPDILFVIVDTLRSDALDLAGARTPHLAALAREGVYFPWTIASASWTLPSHASLFTGRHPSEHGAVLEHSRVPGEERTLAEVLHAAGYETAAFTGGGFLVPETGLDQGFATFEAGAELRFPPFTVHVPFFDRLVRNRYLPLWPLLASTSRSGGMAELGAKVEAWLEGRRDERPLFLLVHTYQVHDYYVYDPEWDSQDGRPPYRGRFTNRLWVHPDEIAAGITEDEARAFREVYEGRVARVDRELGRLFALVRERSASRPLWILVTSDHGEGFDAAARRLLHGGRLHDDLLRVPWILSAPDRLPPGRVVDHPVRLLDVLPSLLDLLGLEAPAGVAGQSIVACLEGGAGWPAWAWSEDRAGEERSVSVRTAEWKLIDGRGGEECYALAVDPGETRPACSSVPAALRRILEEQRQLLPSATVSGTDYDPATLEQLRQLGYVR